MSALPSPLLLLHFLWALPAAACELEEVAGLPGPLVLSPPSDSCLLPTLLLLAPACAWPSRRLPPSFRPEPAPPACCGGSHDGTKAALAASRRGASGTATLLSTDLASSATCHRRLASLGACIEFGMKESSLRANCPFFTPRTYCPDASSCRWCWTVDTSNRCALGLTKGGAWLKNEGGALRLTGPGARGRPARVRASVCSSSGQPEARVLAEPACTTSKRERAQCSRWAINLDLWEG